MKRRIKITENDIRRLVKESVKRIVREEYQNKDADYWLEHSPSRQFTVDNKGKEAMKKLKDMEDGGVKLNKKQEEAKIRRAVRESIKNVLREVEEGDFEDGWLEPYHETDEFDQFHHLGPEISHLHQTYDPALDGEIEDFGGTFINDEGDEELTRDERYWPSEEARGFIDYANKVGDRSTRREEDMDNMWREQDRVRDNAHNHWYRQLNDQDRLRNR